MAIFLGFYAFFGISIAINTNLTEIFLKASLILFLILSRSTGEILGNFGQFLVIWHWHYAPSDKTIFCLFLDASSHLYNRGCPSVRPSVRPSVGPSVRGSRFRQKRENRWFWSQIMMSPIITSSYNDFIIMRTHRWPYGPCYLFVKFCRPCYTAV